VPENHQVAAYKFPRQALHLEKLSLHLFGGLPDHEKQQVQQVHELWLV
jgi:hypothetical protein